MKFLIFSFVGSYAVLLFAQSINNTVLDAMQENRRMELEERKMALEEKKVFLSAFAHSRFTEERAREMSSKLLDQLQDYPKAKKAKHRAQDEFLLMETIATLQSDCTK